METRTYKNRSWTSVISSISQVISLIIGLGICLFVIGGCFAFFASIGRGSSFKDIIRSESILVLRLEGVIIEPSDFLKDLNKYIKNKNIKGALIRIDSPGGGTAASQEVYKEILRLKNLYKKPIVISIGSLGASGAFYISMAGDKIIANEASLLGSIGVIIYLSNLEKLYEWAKIENYVVKTGEFKDMGSNFRPLTARERDVFQDLIDQFLTHFKEVIATNRSVSAELVDEFADGRVFSGDTALVQGFIDQVGTYYDALSVVGEMSGLGEEPDVFEPVDISSQWKEILRSSLKSLSPFSKIESRMRAIFNPKLQGRPLYIMPEFMGL